jgi:hypothetical protein
VTALGAKSLGIIFVMDMHFQTIRSIQPDGDFFPVRQTHRKTVSIRPVRFHKRAAIKFLEAASDRLCNKRGRRKNQRTENFYYKVNGHEISKFGDNTISWKQVDSEHRRLFDLPMIQNTQRGGVTHFNAGGHAGC